ncbi:small nuclear ribonucleoprotein SmD3b isoform X1 [Brassica napus]|uniref:small nuclear ribonucleoprotein SmD3b isoform X1 n=1 Tax=Brassica napus TaxID=3708 RepID=UPI0006AA657A|nr:small nuclear ribonucleoprotein SmD3b isoform X1 [Brassica napus]
MRGAIQRKHDRSVRITGTVSSRTSPLPLSNRGDVDRFMVIPDILKHAPRFKRLDARIKGKSGSLGVGRGRAAMRGKAPATGRGTGGRGAVPPVRR